MVSEQPQRKATGQSVETTADSGPVTTANDYSAIYYHDYAGPPYTYDEPHWKTFFATIADELVAVLKPATAYDAGCAKGFLVRALVDAGVDARGGDISSEAIEGAPPGLRERLEVKDLTEPLDRRYDLITCIEVLEHMGADSARTAIANLCAAADVVVLSTTPDDFQEPTHVNIGQAGDWAQEFARHDFFRRTDIDATFLSPWAVVFARDAGMTAAVLAHRYETYLQPLRREVFEKRQSLLDARRQLDDATAPVMLERDQLVEQLAAMTADRDHTVEQRRDRDLAVEELRTELAAGQRQRLALIDEAIGARAELAQARADNTVTPNSLKEVRLLREQLQASNNEIAQIAVGRAKAEAEVAQLRQAAEPTAQAAAAVDELKGSYTWRIGRVALLPVRVLRRLGRLGRR